VRLTHHNGTDSRLRPGDVVRLSHDGLPMTVSAVLPSGLVRVHWTSGQTQYVGCFEPWRLQKYGGNNGRVA
jgi:uncharacterized protein YodC (DUF2158 family)